MTNRLAEIKADTQMTKELLKVEKESILGKVQDILMTKLIAPCCANLIKLNIRNGLYGKLELYFEVGFWNAEENRIDFGSDISFTLDDDKELLSINYGTMGSYDMTNFYQVKRVRLLNYFFDHHYEIEDALVEIREKYSPKYMELCEHIYELSYEESNLNKKMVEEKRENIATQLVVGVKMEYSFAYPIRDRIFTPDSWCESNSWEITKMTPKFFHITNGNNVTIKVKKESVISEICAERILITK